MTEITDKLFTNGNLTEDEFTFLLDNRNDQITELVMAKAAQVRKEHYGNEVYVRGLIEFTNYCKNNCFYCGIRAGNKKAQRYRLTKEQILDCCITGYATGYRTFVLQGGEDPYYSPDDIAEIVGKIKSSFPDCAVTLSVGEHSKDTYRLWKNAGADRYLLRHETADSCHYSILHPSSLTLANRMRCLYDLKDLGYQVGCGLMVGSPGQTNRCIAKDLCFMKEFQPHMVGIGPFIPHKDTPFGTKPQGSLDLTLFLLAVTRIILPKVLLPATTALGSIKENGRELGILAGANVCMPNLSPQEVRIKYSLYDNKLISGPEAAEEFQSLSARIEKIGYHISVKRGDHLDIENKKG